MGPTAHCGGLNSLLKRPLCQTASGYSTRLQTKTWMEILGNSSHTYLLLLLKKPNFMPLSGHLGEEDWAIPGAGVGVGALWGEFLCFWFLTLSRSVFVLVSFKLFHMCPQGPPVSVFYKLEKWIKIRPRRETPGVRRGKCEFLCTSQLGLTRICGVSGSGLFGFMGKMWIFALRKSDWVL